MGLALQRPQPAARLALDVERPVEVVLGALELQLRPAAALACLPSPAASSTSNRRSRGLEWTISSTRPWLITECISRPRFASASASITSTSRPRAPLSRYSPSPLRSSRR